MHPTATVSTTLPSRAYRGKRGETNASSCWRNSPPSAEPIVNWQLGVGFTSLVFDPVYTLLVGESTGVPIALIGIPIVAAAPALWFIDARHKRQEKIEQQLDTFLLALANALKASPSLGDALNATSTLLRAPMKEELELTVKENQLGVPLDQALLNMARRVGSRAFSGALTTVLIGRQTGGDLSRILETSAATLREMARLEGVVRTKTAEGKAQAWVLGVIPPLLVALLNWMDPLWLQPLSSGIIGYIIVAIAVKAGRARALASMRPMGPLSPSLPSNHWMHCTP